MIPGEIKKYFWDIDAKKLNPKESPEYVSERLLEYGDRPALKWLFKNYPRNFLAGLVLKSRRMSPRSANFWSLFFNLPKDKILCLRKLSQKKQKTIWPY